MTVRVTFRSEVYIDASSVAEAKEKFEAMELYSEKAKKEMSADYIEIDSIEDGDTYDDLTEEWDKAYQPYDLVG